MKNKSPRDELAANSIKLAQNIPDTTKRNACIAAAYAFANKYLVKSQLDKLLEVLRMNDLATILIGDAVAKTVADTKIEIAKKLIKRGISVEAIAEDTDLEESIIRQLKTELDKESA